MSVGIPEIDEDHKRFISLIDELNLSITERMKATEIKKRLQHVIEDANGILRKKKYSFESGNILMRKDMYAYTRMLRIHSKISKMRSYPMVLKRNG